MNPARRRIALISLVTVAVIITASAVAAYRHQHRNVYSSDWSGNPLMTVSQRHGHLDLVAIDPVTVASRALLPLPVTPTPGVSPDAAILRENATTLLALITGADGFQAQVVQINTTRHTAALLGQVSAGRYATIVHGLLVGMTNNGPAPTARSYRLPSLTLVHTTALPITPTAGTTITCLAGQQTGSPANTSAALTYPTPTPTPIAAHAVIGGIDCAAGSQIASLAATPTSDQDKTPSPGDSVIILRGGARHHVAVGPSPGLVAIGDGVFAVDTATIGTSGRTLILCRARTGAIEHTIALPGIDQIDVLTIRGHTAYLLAGTHAIAIDTATGVTTEAALPGVDVAYRVS